MTKNEILARLALLWWRCIEPEEIMELLQDSGKFDMKDVQKLYTDYVEDGEIILNHEQIMQDASDLLKNIK